MARAPPRFLPRSGALSGLLGGGAVLFPPCLALGRMPPDGRVRASGAVWRRGEGGGLRAVLPGGVTGGPLRVALPRSSPLPSLGRHQSGCYWRGSVHGGRGLHTIPDRVRVLAPGVVRVAPLCAGAGPPACCGFYGSRRVAAWGSVAYCVSGVPPPGAAALPGGGGASPGLGGVEGRRPRRPSPASRGTEGGEWGERGEGVACGPRP